MNKMKKVIGYIRVSTEYQKLKENSINNQIKSINEYCNLDALSSCVKLRKLSLYFDSYSSQQTGFDFKLLSKS